MKKRYIFRADGNAHIGVGHIMRSLTIADALAEKTGREAILFACADEDSSQVVRGRGYEAFVFDTDYRDMESELAKWPEIAGNTGFEDTLTNTVIVVDSYNITDKYLEKLREYGKVVLMDDYQNHSYPADAVINYNIYADRDKYLELYGDGVACYTGCEYAPLRSQFTNVNYDVKEEIGDVLITTGGADSMNIAGAIYNLLAYRADLKFHIVSGVYSPFFEELKKKEAENDNLTIYHNVTDMAGLMQKCDLAITAAGSTVYELSAVGVPMICFSYADNQLAGAKYIGEHIAVNAGAYDKNADGTIAAIRDALFGKYLDADYRRACHTREKALVDGRGASRIADLLIGL